MGLFGTVQTNIAPVLPVSEIVIATQMPTTPPPGVVGDYSGSQICPSGGIVQTTGAAPRNIGIVSGVTVSGAGLVTFTFTLSQDLPVSPTNDFWAVSAMVMLVNN